MYNPKNVNITIFISLFIFLMSFSGCAFFGLFKPNTLVKTFEPLPDSESLVLENYKAKFMIRAREVGNLEGVNNYIFTFELKSGGKIKNESDLNNFDIPMMKSLTIYFPATGDTIVVDDERIENDKLTRRPNVFRHELYEYFQVKDVVIPDLHKRIIATAELDIYDRETLERRKTESVTGEFERVHKEKYYRE